MRVDWIDGFAAINRITYTPSLANTPSKQAQSLNINLYS